MIAVLLAAALAATPPPSYLVERVVSVAGQTRRVSVYRDGVVALVSRRSPTAEPQVVRVPLDPAELRTLIEVVDESYDELARAGTLGEAPGASTVELRVAPVDKPPLILRLPFSGVKTVAAAHLLQTLDALETRLASDQPYREVFDAWIPTPGERVELKDGRVVEVLDVLESGGGLMVSVRDGTNPTSRFIALDELRRQAVRRVRP